jgi:hypothetical protein
MPKGRISKKKKKRCKIGERCKSGKIRKKRTIHKKSKKRCKKIKSTRKKNSRGKAGNTEPRSFFERKLVEAVTANEFDEVKKAVQELKKLMTDEEKKFGYNRQDNQELGIGIYNFTPHITQGADMLKTYHTWDVLLWALYLTLETALDNVTEGDIKKTRGVYYIDNKQLLNRWKIIEYLIKSEPDYYLLQLLEEYRWFQKKLAEKNIPQISDLDNLNWSEIDKKDTLLRDVHTFIEKRINNLFKTRIANEEEFMRYIGQPPYITATSSPGTTSSSPFIIRARPFFTPSSSSPPGAPFPAPPIHQSRSRPRSRVDGISRSYSRSRSRSRRSN